MLKPSQSRIDDVENRAQENINEGKTNWPNESYEAGVVAAIRWMRGEDDAADPMDD